MGIEHVDQQYSRIVKTYEKHGENLVQTYPLVIFHIAPYIVSFPTRLMIFHNYISLPEGIKTNQNPWFFLAGDSA